MVYTKLENSKWATKWLCVLPKLILYVFHWIYDASERLSVRTIRTTSPSLNFLETNTRIIVDRINRSQQMIMS